MIRYIYTIWKKKNFHKVKRLCKVGKLKDEDLKPHVTVSSPREKVPGLGHSDDDTSDFSSSGSSDSGPKETIDHPKMDNAIAEYLMNVGPSQIQLLKDKEHSDLFNDLKNELPTPDMIASESNYDLYEVNLALQLTTILFSFYMYTF